ncbi:MAG: hypothetical protein HY941_05145 [Gammaproteobacteria bacterium]|nr:hypothetical protein [Gammaproteobacteria bacterium]
MTPGNILAFSALLSLTGCATPNHMFVASDSSIGVSGSINSTRTSGKVVIGYDRKFVAYVPQKSDDADVMSAFNCTELKITGITVEKFYERLATGEAAASLVTHLPASGKDNECIYAR